jgi:hypothetical protein
MIGLIVDGVRYVLYVETVGNASNIRSIFYNKYASEQISIFLTSVASSGCTYLIRGLSFLTGFSETWCERVFLYLSQLSFFKNFSSHWAQFSCYVCRRCLEIAVSNKYILHPICMLITVCLCSCVYNFL